MAIAVDNAGVASAGMVDLSFVLGGGSDRIVVVTTATTENGADITNVTFNTVNMTFLDQNLTNNGNVEFWYMLEAALPVAETYTIAVTGGESDGAKGASSFTGVDQTTPFGTVFKNNKPSQSPTVDVTGTATTDLVIDAVSSQDPPVTGPDASQTLGYNVSSGGAQNTAASSSQEAGNGGTVTMSWLGAVDDWANMGVALQEAAGGDEPELFEIPHNYFGGFNALHGGYAT